MPRNKDIIKDALVSAQEIEKAVKANAIDTIVEAFTPRLEDVIRQTLNEEGPGPQLPDPVTKLAKGEEEETESSEVQNDAQVSDGHPEKITPDQGDKEIHDKGKKHDLDRAADKPGQENGDDEFGEGGPEVGKTHMDGALKEDDAYLGKKEMAGALKEEEDDYEDDMEMEEGEDHDTGKLHFDDRDSGDSEFDTMGEALTFEDDDEVDVEDDEEAAPAPSADDGDDVNINIDADGTDEPAPEAPEAPAPEGGDDEELEIPEELFDEPEDTEAAPEEALPQDEELDPEEEPAMEPMDDMGGEEEFEEGLYIRREGKFMKVDPAEALEDQMNDLEEEKMKLANAVSFLKGQLGEVNLFNAKLAHLVKLYESGLFSRHEKKQIAERLDECTSIKSVKATYKKLVAESSERTVLDSIHDVVTESRVRRSTKPTGESVYESDEMKRMRRIAGIDKD